MLGRYEGQSATQQLHSLGVGPGWHRGSPQAAPRGEVERWPAFDYNKPWFKKKEGEWYCDLCGAYADEWHVVCQKHTTREANPACYGFGTAEDEREYDEPWYEKRNGEWYCLLCSAFANQGHIESEKHKKRESYPEGYGYLGAAPLALCDAASSESGVPPPWQCLTCPDKGATYYHNPVTKVTQWDRPQAPPPPPPPALAAGPYTGGSSAAVPYPGGSGVAAANHWEAMYAAPWFEKRQGEYFCLLCNKWASETHLTSIKHEKAAASPEWYGFRPQLALTAPNFEADVAGGVRAQQSPVQNQHLLQQQGQGQDA